ncbi:MAG: class I SAM-dependent methyltransferase [Vicinamibacterales bacterium]
MTNFDPLARHYDWMEAVTAGSLLQRARTAWLPALSGCRRVLSAGEGHGRFAQAFLERHPHAELTCVDASARMLDRARRRIGHLPPHPHWVHAALPAWRPAPAVYDAIVTCFFLDCFPPAQLACVVDALAASATDRSAWLVVDFAVPARGLARWRARAMHASMYAFFRAVANLPASVLTPPDALLRAHGFRLDGRREYSWGLVRADLWRR